MYRCWLWRERSWCNVNWLRMRNIKWEDGTHVLRARRRMKRKLTTWRVRWGLDYLKSLNTWGSLRSDRSWSDIEDCSWKFYIYKWWLVGKSAGAGGAMNKERICKDELQIRGVHSVHKRVWRDFGQNSGYPLRSVISCLSFNIPEELHSECLFKA